MPIVITDYFSLCLAMRKNPNVIIGMGPQQGLSRRLYDFQRFD